MNFPAASYCNCSATLKQKIEETGKRLACFAKTLSLPFSFKVATVTDSKDVNEDLINLSNGEVVAFYASVALSHIIRLPDCLESLIRVLR
ncbi:hypothetical protein Pint_24366 [Pistacia integerrima]|uniref:Uncharacterized protein n=1 Tax=Pistacia integerrima TaxID=434235 RepID=A0ACC0YC35_9ROSI|nr:hypothetical protein Pint_24366 [Pistacia integerrima]